MTEPSQPDFTALTVQLLSAYLSNNQVQSDSLAALIQSTRDVLAEGATPSPAAVEKTEAVTKFAPAVTARKSLASPEHILSMIDGKPYKALKRHLSTHGLTPAQYRARYKLPDSYPMVAPAYSEARRATAKRLGLGRKPATPSVVPAAAKPAPKPRGRKPAQAKAADAG